MCLPKHVYLCEIVSLRLRDGSSTCVLLSVIRGYRNTIQGEILEWGRRGWEGQRRREGKEEWGGKERVRQKKRAGKEGEGWELDNGKRYTTTQKIDGDIGR